MIIVKYNKKTKEVICKCGGQVAVGGDATYQFPLGFGFHPGSTKFAIDVARYKGWIGDCLKCGKRVLSYRSRRVISKYPKKINNKLAQGVK